MNLQFYSAVNSIDIVLNKMKNKQELNFNDQCLFVVSCVSMAENYDRHATSDYIRGFDGFKDLIPHPLISKFIDSLPTDYQISLMQLGATVCSVNINGADKLSFNHDLKVKKQKIKTYIIKKRGTNEIKIGRSVDILKRINTLKMQSGCEMDTLLIINRNFENDLHKRFSHLRTIGEWFNDSSNEIQDFASKGEQWVIEKFISEGLV